MADITDNEANLRRIAAIDTMHRFAHSRGYRNPPVREEMRDGFICFIGTAPNGREYAIGYDPAPGETVSGEAFPAPSSRWVVA